MATPLELLKARRASTQKQVQGMLTPQGGAGDRIGRGLVTAARALSGGFDDPDEQALATYQEQNKDFEAAQQAQGGGAFTAPFKPDYDPRSDLSGFTPEMRELLKSKNIRKDTPFTQEGMMNQAKLMYQNDNFEGAKQAMAYAKALAPSKSNERKIIKGNDGFNYYQDTQERALPNVGAKPQAARDPLVKPMKEGNETVTKQFNRINRQWEEISRGKSDGGVSVMVDNGVKPWNAVDAAYQRDSENVRGGYKDVTRVETALSVEGGASNQAIQAALADTFGGSTRALANLQQWANFGTLTERVTNTVSKFVRGDYTEVSRKDAARLVHAYKKNLAIEHQAINDRFDKVGKANKVDSDTFMIDVVDVKDFDFGSMSKNEILMFSDLDQLEGWQIDDLDKALQVLEAQ